MRSSRSHYAIIIYAPHLSLQYIIRNNNVYIMSHLHSYINRAIIDAEVRIRFEENGHRKDDLLQPR